VPNDPEYRIYHHAFYERRCQTVSQSDQHMTTTYQTLQLTNCQAQRRQPPSNESDVKAESMPSRGGINSLSSARSTTSRKVISGSSSLRQEQMTEIEQIRIAFEKHKLPFHAATFER